jgi:hypothetical protein
MDRVRRAKYLGRLGMPFSIKSRMYPACRVQARQLFPARNNLMWFDHSAVAKSYAPEYKFKFMGNWATK